MTELAYAKLNLSLDILDRRPDGYHDLRMVMQTVDLSDEVTVEPGGGQVTVQSNLSFLPSDRRKLAVAAALRFQEAVGPDLDGVFITIRKQIPVCAGLAGGSSDAAAVLRALNALTGAGLTPAELAALGEAVGSDVPYCVLGGTALAEGRGERLTPLPPLPPCDAVLCKPGWSVSTPVLFARADGKKLRCRPDTAGLLAALEAGDLAGAARRMYNVFEDVLTPREWAGVQAIKNTLIQHGALGASMSGTGPTVFGLFDSHADAWAAYEELKQTSQETFLARTI